jgi:bacillithiol biosynthesis cysteine-adding enzyme BshC
MALPRNDTPHPPERGILLEGKAGIRAEPDADWIWHSAAIMIGGPMTPRLEFQDFPFRNLPRQNESFLQYIDRAPRVTPFYAGPPDIAALRRAALGDAPDIDSPRSVMAGILRRQNAAWGNDKAALDRVDELEKPGSAAILTGQQVGLFAGPLYTIYKAMTALKLSEELRRFGINAIPVFWMDADDHDLEEVTRLTALDQKGRLHTIDCRHALFGPGPETSRPVGSILLREGIREVIGKFMSWLAPTPWEDHISSLLESSCRPGLSLTQAFAVLMTRLFGPRGLVLFDPRDPEAKSLMAPVFKRAILENARIHEALGERSRSLQDAGLPPQVAVRENATVLFLEDRGERRSLVRQGRGFALKNSDSVFGVDRLLAMAEGAPELFSANVLLRPIVQDHLFPTVAYVGGPAEVSYFAQIETLYQLFGRPMPVIWPRSSLTFLSGQVRTLMKDNALGFADCVNERARLLSTLARAGPVHDSMAEVARLRHETVRALDAIRPGLADIDPTQGIALDTARRKILHNVTRIENRLALQGGKTSNLDGLADFLLNNCLPNGKLQERELTVHQLIAMAGPRVLEEIYQGLRIDNFSHLLIWIGKQDA